jgi:hypothetical protein
VLEQPVADVAPEPELVDAAPVADASSNGKRSLGFFAH